MESACAQDCKSSRSTRDVEMLSRTKRAELYQNGYPAPLLLAPDVAKDCEVYVTLGDILSHIERGGMNIVAQGSIYEAGKSGSDTRRSMVFSH